MKVSVKWVDGVSFAAESESGHTVVMDGPPDLGGRDLGPRPMELSRSYSSRRGGQLTGLQTGWNIDQLSWCTLYRSGEKSLFHSFKPENQILYFPQGGGILNVSYIEKTNITN